MKELLRRGDVVTVTSQKALDKYAVLCNAKDRMIVVRHDTDGGYVYACGLVRPRHEYDGVKRCVYKLPERIVEHLPAVRAALGRPARPDDIDRQSGQIIDSQAKAA